MRMFRTLMVLPLALFLALSTSAAAEERHAVPSGQLAAGVARHVNGQDADRAAIREALAQPEVQAMAAKAGVDADRLAASIDTLSPSTLDQAASVARDVNQALVGGASTVTISTTTVIIVLLIVILIVVAD